MNLLPKQHKKDLRLEAWRRYLIFLGFYLTTALVSAATLLLPSLFYLQFQIGELEKTRDLGKRTPDYETMIKGSQTVQSANKSLHAFATYLKSRPSVTPTLEEVIFRMPPEIYFTNIVYTRSPDGASRTIKLSGQAQHRDNLRAFVAELQASSEVSGKILVPDTVYRKEENTPFSFDVKLKP